MDDWQLLSRYVERGDQAAFAALARRHAGLVYSAARRRVRDADLAHDVTQVVFLVLARKTASIRPGTVLPAWLLKVTGYTAKNMSKSELRRRRHEHQAASQKGGLTTAAATEVGGATSEDWEQIAPLLDDAMDSLGESARSAVVLRWFEGRSFRDVGERLGISEEAAKQKVFRALGRMRRYMGRHGVAVPVTALTTQIGANAVQAAPAATVEAAIVAGTPGAAATSAAGSQALVQTVAALAGWTAARVLAGCAAAVLAVSVAAVAVNVSLAENTRTLTADRQLAPSTAARTAGTARPEGIVFTHNGWPLTDASVLISTASKPAVYHGKPDAAAVLTGSDGRFALSPVEEPYLLLVWHDTAGFATVSGEHLADGGGRIELLPWARVEGNATSGGTLVANAAIVLGHGSGSSTRLEAVTCEFETRADAGGRFTFPRVPAGDGWVARRVSPESASPPVLVHRTYLTAQPAGRISIRLGGAAGSRAVVGKFVAVDAADARPRVGASPSWQATLVRGTAGQGRPAYQGAMFETALVVAPDGSFRADDVPAGPYRLVVRGTVARAGSPPVTSAFEQDVQVRGHATDAHDLGTIVVKFPRIDKRAAVPPPPTTFDTEAIR